MQQKGLSIIIPAYNEAANISALIKHAKTALRQYRIPYEIIVVDDRSTDKTRQIVKSFMKSSPVKLLAKMGPQGKGFSILQGYQESIYEYVALIDADTDAGQLSEYLPVMFREAEKRGFAVARTKRSKTARFLSFSPYHGPKIFRREVFEYLDKKLVSAWVIGSPLVHTAQELGYHGYFMNLKRPHDRRPKPLGAKILRSIQKFIGTVRPYVVPRQAYKFEPTLGQSMIGAGVAYKKNRFVTHTTLPVDLSALTTFAPWQIFTFLGIVTIVSIGIVADAKATLTVLTAVLSTVYLIDVLFNLVVTLKSLHFPPEVGFSADEVENLRDSELPTYTILCPLYKEAQVLPQFVEAMAELDWPQEKLEIMLLLEEDDTATIAAARAMRLPSTFRIVIVPESNPKTKPKACNYGLAHARGEYIVIFDAEDKPEADQLKKAYLGFQKSPKNVACLQAKLNYYNPHHNLLTRLFTAEYSLWFDVILPGLQSINTAIPLGGTSNHFKKKVLQELQGWDPFNVTEDADLGTRLFSAGYKTAIINSTTLEEANSNLKNWFRQRSRWLKGYMQTYLVHMRHPLLLLRKQGWHALIFQLVVGGKIAFIMINPFLWIMTISYFALYRYVGPAIEAIYPAYIFYMAVTSLVIGNFIAFYNYMIGAAKRGHYELIKFVYLIPLYWLAISGAAAISFFQLLFKPHYWEKTIHGLHLMKSNALLEKVRADEESRTVRAHRVQKIADLVTNAFTAGGVMVAASMFGNIMNFLYNAYLSRNLDLAAFGEISLFGSFLYISSVPISPLSRIMTKNSAFLFGKYGKPVKEFWYVYRQKLLRFGMIAAGVWLLATPLLQRFFRVDEWVPFIIFAPVWLITTLGTVNGAFLAGNLIFTVMAMSVIVETITKFGFAALFIGLGRDQYVYAAIPLSLFAAFLLEYWQIARVNPKPVKVQDKSREFRLSRKFYLTSILSKITSATYLSLDVLLAKHFLSPVDAGAYSYIALAGKMIFFFGSMFSQFILPYVSRDIGAGKNPRGLFVKVFALVAIVNVFSYLVFGIFGWFTAPLLWGSNAQLIVPYLPIYGLGMVFFSLTSVVVTYQEVRGRYLFPVVAFGLSVLQIIGMYMEHSSLSLLVSVVTIAGGVSLAVSILLSVYYGYVVDTFRAAMDFVGLFRSLPVSSPLPDGRLRILIFNWRDLRHVWSGGAEVYIHELAKRWVRDGNKVTIFSGNDGNSKRFEKIDGVNIIRRGGFYVVYLWAFLYYIFRLRGRYDVIIDSENGLPFFTPLYAQEKVYLLIHHVHQEVFRKSLPPPFSWIASFLEKRVMPIVYRKTEVITVSPSSKADILTHKLTKHDPHIVYNGIDFHVCKPGRKSKKPMVLYLGRLTTAKSIHVLLRAAEHIISRIPDVQITVAGDGPHKGTLVRLAKSLGVDKHIVFTGKVTDEEKVELYQKAWVFVNPSLIEGWGITTIEANACGTPVVASNVAGLMDAVHNPHSGFLVPYGDVAEFSKYIIKLLTNSRMRTRMSRESITWARKFDWDKSAELSLRILRGEN